MKDSSPVVAAVRRFLARTGLSPARVVVGVSGGPDSVALLLALIHLWMEFAGSNNAACSITVAHLNHKLRGSDSDADEQFVRNLHAALSERVKDLRLRCEAIDVAALVSNTGGNLEAIARRIRYDWLSGVAQEAGTHLVATGHTADDQAETVLFRLLRGTGLKGLSGIAPRRRLGPAVELIRPLLQVRRNDIIEFLRLEKQGFCQDRSNLDRRYTRSRLRHDLLPQLARDYNAAVVSVLGRLAEQARDAFAARERQTEQLLAKVERPRAGHRIILDCMGLNGLPRQRVRAVFHCLWKREGWGMGRMGYRQWDQLAGVALGEAAAADLPGKVHARRVGTVVQVGPAS